MGAEAEHADGARRWVMAFSMKDWMPGTRPLPDGRILRVRAAGNTASERPTSPHRRGQRLRGAGPEVSIPLIIKFPASR